VPARLFLGVGLLAVSGHLVSLAPGGPLVDWSRRQTLGIVVSHAAVGLLGLGLTRPAWAWLQRRAARGEDLGPRVWALLGAAAAAQGLLIIVAPGYARQVITREWGLIEPLQFTTYLGTAALALAHARRRTGDARIVHLTAGAWALIMALEEVDYLGLLSGVASLAGAPRGRLGGRHLGGLHDLLNIAHGLGALWLVAIGAAGLLGLGLLAWSLQPARRRRLSAALREIRTGGAGLLGLAAVLMALGELNDIDDRLFAGTGLPTGKFVEEPAELLAALALLGWAARALAGTWAQPVTPARSDPTA
jgi:hypothetical protein